MCAVVEYITPEEAAEMLGVNKKRLSAIAIGHGWARRQGEGQLVLWRKADVDAAFLKRKSRPVPTNAKPKASQRERPCLCCRTPFMSEGFHNRMCDACRNDTRRYNVAPEHIETGWQHFGTDKS